MVFRIAAIVLRLCGGLALILGLLFWSGNAYNLLQVHMLLGLLVVLSLWIVGIGQAFSRGGSWPLAGGALLLGLHRQIAGDGGGRDDPAAQKSVELLCGHRHPLDTTMITAAISGSALVLVDQADLDAVSIHARFRRC